MKKVAWKAMEHPSLARATGTKQCGRLHEWVLFHNQGATTYSIGSCELGRGSELSSSLSLMKGTGRLSSVIA